MLFHRHGHWRTRTYTAWQQMKVRCEWPDHPAWEHYGGRGIKVCDRWRESFADFLADMGKNPGRGYSLDRIDVNGNYEPSNCRWATATTQARNKRTSKLEPHEYEQIKWLVSLGYMQKDVAAFFGIGRPFTSYVINGRRAA